MKKKGILISLGLLCIMSIITLALNFYIDNYMLILSITLILLIAICITLIVIYTDKTYIDRNHKDKNLSYKNQLKILLKDTKKTSLKSKIIKIAENYNLRDETDKVLLEKYIKDCIVDIDKTAFASIFLIFVPVIINIFINKINFLSNKIGWIAIGVIVAAFVIAFLICIWINQYRFYKLYLEVLNDLDSDKIKLIEENGIKNIVKTKKFDVEFTRN
ncbi:hypothetical protein [Clostridium perfringens]|uniref:hypothetical protein n=1 Tax=Clostridium perfringens TaxID=1502 RepID=UPI0011210C7B|nr:hypothetical protein [Clostridium perfringens]TPE20645.1 hypothetical protein FJM09_04285 [Clostridium perfringens]